MRKRKLNKSSLRVDTPLSSSGGTVPFAELPSDYSLPSLGIGTNLRYQEIHSVDVQLTVRSKVELSRKQILLIAGLSLREISDKGISLKDWIVIEYLYSRILGPDLDPLEKRDIKELEISQLLKLILLSGTWMGLEEKKQIPDDIKFFIEKSNWVPSKRTAGSWKESYSLDKFLEIRTVPLDVFLERSQSTKRYSSYTKGYGESSRMGSRQKTRPSAELDGKEVNLLEENGNIPINHLTVLFDQILAEIKYRIKIRK